jgi:hypothetical protein
VALLNLAIDAAFEELQTAVLTDSLDLDAARSAKRAIVSRVEMIYQMCVLRYAFALDKRFDNPELDPSDRYKEQGEGLTFWRVIAPLVAATVPTGAAAISELFDLASAPASKSNYCAARSTLRLALPAGLTRDDMGELEETMWDPSPDKPPFGQCTSFAPVNSVLDEARVSTTVAAITNSLLDEDFAAAKGLYIGSHLEALAQQARFNGSIWSTHFGLPAPFDTFFTRCVDGAGVWAGKSAARLECVEKTAWDAVPFSSIDLLLDA